MPKRAPIVPIREDKAWQFPISPALFRANRVPNLSIA